MEGAAVTVEPPVAADPTAPGAKGLKSNAIGYAQNLVISTASVAPAYSLAATLGFIVAVAGVGTHAPAVLLVSFIPMLFVSIGYRFFNLADPDAGTTFAWVTRAFGPQLVSNSWAHFWVWYIGPFAGAVIAASLYELLYLRPARPVPVGPPETGVVEIRPGDAAVE